MAGAGLASAAITNLALPALQAAATILILKYQEKQYEKLSDKRISIIEDCLSKYCDSIDNALVSNLFSEAYGFVPKAAEYVEVDALQEQFNTINDNLQNIKASDRLMAAVNLLNRNDDIARMVAFAPCFMENIHKSSMQIKDLIEGRLPLDSVTNVTKNRAENDLIAGRVGNSCGTTLRDMGIARLAAQERGLSRMTQMADLIQRVSPHERRMNIQDMMVKPEYRLGLALSQHQLIQNSLQNFYNLEAQGNPTSMAKLSVKLNKIGTSLQSCAQKASLMNAFVPDFASMLAPQINSITGALLGSNNNTQTQVANRQQATAPAPQNTSKETGYVDYEIAKNGGMIDGVYYNPVPGL